MNWPDERYVRLYTRDTGDWLALSFEAQALFALLLRKVDRSGIFPLGRHGKRAVAIAIGHAGRWKTLEGALEELLIDGCVVISGDELVMPNYIEAQTCAASDKIRQAEYRSRRRDMVLEKPNKTDGLQTEASRNVTESHEASQGVTDGHKALQNVTLNCAVPSCTEPSLAESDQEPFAAVASATSQPGLKLESSNPTPTPDEPKPKHTRDRKPPDPDRVPLTNEMRDDVLRHIQRALGAPNAQFTLAGAGGGIKGLRALVQLHSVADIKATITRNASDIFNRTNRSADWFVSLEAFDKGTRGATGPPRIGATATTTTPDQQARIDAMRNMPDEPEVRHGT